MDHKKARFFSIARDFIIAGRSIRDNSHTLELQGAVISEINSCYNSKGFSPSIQICALSSVG